MSTHAAVESKKTYRTRRTGRDLRRQPTIETLGSRQLMAADLARVGPVDVEIEEQAVVSFSTHDVEASGAPWQNPAHPADVNNDGLITPFDVLHMVNELNANRARQLPPEMPSGEEASAYVDANGDGWIAPMDVLFVINEINQNGVRRLEPKEENSLGIDDGLANADFSSVSEASDDQMNTNPPSETSDTEGAMVGDTSAKDYAQAVDVIADTVETVQALQAKEKEDSANDVLIDLHLELSDTLSLIASDFHMPDS